jgi:hypothetical protein
MSRKEIARQLATAASLALTRKLAFGLEPKRA